MTVHIVRFVRTPAIVAGLALTLLFTEARPAQATPLFPGGTVTPSLYAGADTLVSSVVSTPFSTGTVTGTLVSAVFKDAITGLMNFYYQVFNSSASTDGIVRATHTDFFDATFGIYATDVNRRVDDPDGGGAFVAGSNQAPILADRSASGTTVGFFFFTGSSGATIAPNSASDVLVIRTDAPSFTTTGSTSIIDGGSATVTTFEPTGQPVPEPGSIFLLGTGLLGLASLARRRLQNRQ